MMNNTNAQQNVMGVSADNPPVSRCYMTAHSFLTIDGKFEIMNKRNSSQL